MLSSFPSETFRVVEMHLPKFYWAVLSRAPLVLFSCRNSTCSLVWCFWRCLNKFVVLYFAVELVGMASVKYLHTADSLARCMLLNSSSMRHACCWWMTYNALRRRENLDRPVDLLIFQLFCQYRGQYPILISDRCIPNTKSLLWDTSSLLWDTKSLLWDNKSLFWDNISLLWDLKSLLWDTKSLLTRPPHRGQVQCTEPEPRKKASPLFNSLCYEVMLPWAYIIFRNNSSNSTGKKIYIYFQFF